MTEATMTEKSSPVPLTTDLYAEIKRRLVKRGIPPEEVAFIHDAKTHDARKRLFDAVSAGKVRVLIGSTEKMGTGMNAQERLVAVHHFTPPWRPADITQQMGRAHRQGNRYPQVFQFIHAAMRSFEPYMWQTLENKATFIEQLDADHIGAREAADISETALTFSEVKALATGDSRMAERISLEMEVSRLRTLRHTFSRNQARLQLQYDSSRRREKSLRRRIAALEEVLARNLGEKPFRLRLVKSADDPTLLTFDEKHKKEAGAQLLHLITTVGRHNYVPIGDFHGLPVGASFELVGASRKPKIFAIALLKVGEELFSVRGSTPKGIIMSLQHALRKFAPDYLRKMKRELEDAVQQQADIQKELARPWEYDEQLAEARRKLDALREAMDTDGDILDKGRSRDADEFERAARRLAEALEEIRAMHADPAVLSRFDVGTAQPQPEPVPAAVEALERKVVEKQAELAELEFQLAANRSQPLPDKPVQLDLFGGFAEVAQTRPRRRRRR